MANWLRNYKTHNPVDSSLIKYNNSDGDTNSVKDKLDAAMNQSSLLTYVYPVGSIYMSTNNVSPATFLGGTWVQIKDRFLLTAGDTYSAGATGGEAVHTLTTAEMPAHTHPTAKPNLVGNGSVAGTYGYHADGSFSATGSTGGGQAHNNMPPYLVIYAWRRTA